MGSSESGVLGRQYLSKFYKVIRVLVLSIVLVLLVGNLAISFATIVAKANMSPSEDLAIPGIPNLMAVDDRLWRGGAPATEGYEALAGAGVRTVIDLRAEASTDADARMLRRLGVDLVRIPIRDGQAPTTEQVAAFLKTVDESSGKVFVHCGAGVGRTGTMAAAYLVRSGSASPFQALARNLAVGPPSLEQMAFVEGMSDGSFDRPSVVVTGLSRLLDAPRRLMVRLGI
jgi:protein tyrosine phosphatase (PTP) superfamily phosphohydrolase (DUF442 family)